MDNLKKENLDRGTYVLDQDILNEYRKAANKINVSTSKLIRHAMKAFREDPKNKSLFGTKPENLA